MLSPVASTRKIKSLQSDKHFSGFQENSANLLNGLQAVVVLWNLTVSTKRVLIIDDEDDVREVAQTSLEMMGGWEVSTAGSSTEGLIKAEAEQPDAVLLDVMLPDMDGPTTFHRLQENPRTQRIPVILLTAKVQVADQRRLAGLGVAAVLTKPFDPIALAAQIAEVLGWDL